MRSHLAAPPVLGAQRPRHLWVPDYVSSSGTEAIELAAHAGIAADPWQEFVVVNMLGERDDGRWAAFEVGLEVPRQNGKGGVYEIRELAGLFLLGERLLIHSAHEYKTAEQALDRMEAILEGCSDLSRRVRTVKRSHGQEGIYLKTGQVLRYFTRTSSGGRGFSCDFLGLDEAMKIKHSMHAAMFPTMAARANPQILYAGSAVDQETMDDGVVFARIRERGIAGGDQRLAYFGWSAPFEHPGEVSAEAACDPANWAAANPALSIRVAAEYVADEQRALSARGFAVERLGVGDWPNTEDAAAEWQVISETTWTECNDPRARVKDPVCLAFDVRPDRGAAAIAAAGELVDRVDARLVEIVEHHAGTGWVVPRLLELTERHRPVLIVCDERGPAASLLKACADAGLQVSTVNTAEYGQACGAFYDRCEQGSMRHLGDQAFDAAVAGAVQRPLGEAWAWSRTNSAVDITPLVAGTLAMWGFENAPSDRSWRPL